MTKILEMKKITKRFPGVLALKDVDLELETGEILALIGENGAGKSTLIKILAGAYSPDSGEIILHNEKLQTANPGEILGKGIAVMYQELNCLENLSIAENIFLGNIPTDKFGKVSYRKLYSDTAKLLDTVGLKKDPKIEVADLSVAERQMMEIAKVLSKPNEVLVMDEPTSALNEAEIKTLFKIMREYTASGKSIIYVSHKLSEVFEITDRISVLRDGVLVGSVKTKKTNTTEIVSMMVGRTIEDMYPKMEIKKGGTVLDVNNISGGYIKNISFSVAAGEIVGLFGLMGSGRTEIAESIFGKRTINKGTISVAGNNIKIKNPRSSIKAGIAYVPRERKQDSLILEGSVKENMTLAILNKLQGLLCLKLTEEVKIVSKWIDKLSIKTSSVNSQIASLSGGNQQKVVMARWLITKPKVLILNEPTRGIDVGAKVEIYRLLEDLCQEGLGILLISSETPEIIGISDKIIVVHDGTIIGEFNRSEFNQEKIMRMAVGG